jgi:hypothetical protein
VAVRSEWPEEHRWALDLFLASPQSEGIKSNYTPRFLFLSRQQNRLLFTTWGYQGWVNYAQPWLAKRLGSA